jgi:HSP20 family protein
MPAEQWDPFGEIDPMGERMRRLLEQTFDPLGVALGSMGAQLGEIWAPHVDVEEVDDAYVLEVEVPGAKREDLTIEEAGNELMIAGEIKRRERKGVMRRETRRSGRFAYRLALPEPVEAGKIEAKLSDGVLTVRVPKSQRAERRQIEIKG